MMYYMMYYVVLLCKTALFLQGESFRSLFQCPRCGSHKLKIHPNNLAVCLECHLQFATYDTLDTVEVRNTNAYLGDLYLRVCCRIQN